MKVCQLVAGAVEAAIRGRERDGHVRQGQGQRQPPATPPQRKVLRKIAHPPPLCSKNGA